MRYFSPGRFILHAAATVLVLALLLAILPMNAGRAMGTRARKANVVIILADDLGWRDLGCYGNTFHETPNIDTMARNGMRFTDFYVCAACMPSRVGIMTGKNPSRLHNLWGMKQPCLTAPWDPLPPEEATFAEVFQRNGYATGYVGKWGIRHWKDEGEKDNGFGSLYCHQPWYYLPNYIHPYEGEIEELKGRGDQGHLVDYMTSRAEEFIAGNKDRPFLLVMAHFAPHSPLKGQGRKDLVAKYRAKAERAGTPVNADYCALVEGVDESTGRIMAKLKELGIDDRTVVVFLSDNGGENDPEYEGEIPITTNAPLRAGKATIYEGGIRVPMIVRWPGAVATGSTCSVPCTAEDVYPTLLEIAGLPDARGHVPDGLSMVPLLTGTGTPARDAIFMQWEGAMVRQGNYKLIEFPPYYPTPREIEGARAKAKKKNREFTPPKPSPYRLELYDLGSDIGETRNLALEKPELAAAMRKRLHAWMIEMHGRANYTLERVTEDARKQGQEYPPPD